MRMKAVPTHHRIRNSRTGAMVWQLYGLAMLLAVTCAGPLRLSDARAAGIGDPAPDFTLENVLDTAPDVFQLSAYRGQIVVLTFFAYW